MAALTGADHPVRLDQARISRRKRELTLAHAVEATSDDEYLQRLAQLRAEEAVIDEGARPCVSPDVAVAWLRSLGRPGGG